MTEFRSLLLGILCLLDLLLFLKFSLQIQDDLRGLVKRLIEVNDEITLFTICEVVHE